MLTAAHCTVSLPQAVHNQMLTAVHRNKSLPQAVHNKMLTAAHRKKKLATSGKLQKADSCTL